MSLVADLFVGNLQKCSVFADFCTFLNVFENKMSDNFFSQFYANFRNMNDLSVSIKKMKKVNSGNFVLPKTICPP